MMILIEHMLRDSLLDLESTDTFVSKPTCTLLQVRDHAAGACIMHWHAHVK